MFKNDLTKHAAAVGGFIVLFYAVCLLWRYTMSDPALLQLHLQLLRLSLPGFTGYGAASVVWGGFLSFVYGFIASVAYHKLHAKCCGMAAK